jgi:hypothetical protein
MLCGCQKNQIRHQDSDPFYSNYETWDTVRFPLIKPYEAVKANNRWSINLPISPYENGIPNYIDIYQPEKVSVSKNVIMVYTTYTPVDVATLGEQPLYWFVLLPDEKREIGFDNEKEFLIFIKKYGINSPNWQDIDTAFQQFYVTGCLDWVPGCK